MSVDAVNRALSGDRLIFLALQNDDTDEPEPNELRTIGTIGAIRQMAKMPTGAIHIIVEGLQRAKADTITKSATSLRAVVRPLPEAAARTIEVDAYLRRLHELIDRALSLSSGLSQELRGLVAGIDDPLRLVYLLASLLDMKAEEKQKILEEDSLTAKLEAVAAALGREITLLEMKNKIESTAQQEMTDAQREYYLRQQLKAIQDELGEGEKTEIQELRKRIADAKLPEAVAKVVEREVDRLERMTPASPEYQMIRTYIDWVLDVPWSTTTEDRLDPIAAREVLDQDHYDLDKVKERIVEYLAVQKLKSRQAAAREAASGLSRTTPEVASGLSRTTPEVASDLSRTTPEVASGFSRTTQIKGPILCFVGPPGVGKTSLGQSIARAVNRKFVRISLGGVRDEAEIRGHRRTYIGAIPGRIVQALKQAGAMNPVFMLDEIDKVSAGFQGDPSAALLEVLDPSQNHAFRDHYLEINVDLSHVLFIATANQLGTIHPALLDRMEIISLSGYTEEEKLHIAERYLVPRQLEENGLSPELVTIEEPAIRRIINEYTREAGVRNLERQIGAVGRKIAARVAASDAAPSRFVVTAASIPDYLGPVKFHREVAFRVSRPGVATGVAWTEVGGDVLFVEARMLPSGHQNLILTGQLGNVMQESARAALSHIRAQAAELGIPEDAFDGHDLHIHVPAGAIPKDGPSAGVTMATAIVSVLRNQKVREDVAMTGEITLSGLVLPVGGIREKALAARRYGIKEFILPALNEPDLAELPPEVHADMHFVPVATLEDALKVSLPQKVAAS
jgi:ATP-dependent Lon protease